LRFSRGGWFSIDVLSLVDEVDADQLFSHRREKTPNPDPSKPRRVGHPEKPNHSFDDDVLKRYDLTVKGRE
jgi:hypothetical protein